MKLKVDCGGSDPTPALVALTPQESSDLSNTQADAQAAAQVEDTRHAQAFAVLSSFLQNPSVIAFMQDPSPTGAATVATLKEVVPALKVAIRVLTRL